MPTYRNDKEAPVYWGTDAWAPGEIRALSRFVPHEMLGLTRMSDEPVVPDPILLSQDLAFPGAGSQTVVVPEDQDAFSATFVALEGSVEVRCNTTSGNPVRIDAGKGIDFVRKCWRDEIASFVVTASEASKVRVLLERGV